MSNQRIKDSFIRGIRKAQEESKMRKTEYELRTELIERNIKMEKVNIEELEFTNTKRGDWVQDRIKAHEYYDIYMDEVDFTINSKGWTTQKEIIELERITGRTFLAIGPLLTRLDLWVEWVSF